MNGKVMWMAIDISLIFNTWNDAKLKILRYFLLSPRAICILTHARVDPEQSLPAQAVVELAEVGAFACAVAA